MECKGRAVTMNMFYKVTVLHRHTDNPFIETYWGHNIVYMYVATDFCLIPLCVSVCFDTKQQQQKLYFVHSELYWWNKSSLRR